MNPMILAASTQRTIGWVLAIVVMVGFVVYLLFSFRIGKRELGSEVELAANRKPYLDDDELETFRLDRALVWSLVTLTAVSMILPVYWLMEPTRQENAIVDWVHRFEKRGASNFEEACSSCHGPDGVGGVAAFTLVDAEGAFVAQVEWKAPALTSVLSQFDEAEVRHILNYGRPGTPMPAWGLPGGGPMTTQQVEQLIVYLRSIQLDQRATTAQIDAGIVAGARTIVTAADAELTDAVDIEAAAEAWLERASDPTSADYLRYGELIFNNPAAQGANSCARCHTPGFSLGAADEDSTAALLETWPRLVESGILTGWQPAQGHVGPSLEGVETHFPTAAHQEEFVRTGSELGVGFGNARSGTGMMPGFGGRVDPDVVDYDTGGDAVYSRVLTPEQIAAVVAYARSR
ncbi:MAG: c-type cytochrome [Acidimicrobiales bacterium]|jgi:mono/diheme cytochrome c family protein|nr:c-type cytochrome [Acidimicrobiales bacterium]MDP6649400.1 c-type cytochrome [Acidimicrobiales bacterium]MDP6760486.1 c-type cytochrome [Acidimicrobiales bacterium]|tara:strand:- start:54 stop:1265 length:1212 start_codon:yes stop_codon:yes gene_type:complete